MWLITTSPVTIVSQSYDEEEEVEPNLFQKLALHWRTAGPRLVFLGAFLLMVTLVCCGCLRLVCRYWCKSMQDTSACCFLPGVKEMCQMCYTDPSESIFSPPPPPRSIPDRSYWYVSPEVENQSRLPLLLP